MFVVSYYNDATERELRESKLIHLYHFQKVNRGDYAILSNKESRYIFGFAKLSRFQDGNISRVRHLLDDQVYTGENMKYNKYEICCEEIKILKRPITYDRIQKMVFYDLESIKFHTNICKGNQAKFAKLFCNTSDSEKYCKRANELFSMISGY